jgi:hypothetical protein
MAASSIAALVTRDESEKANWDYDLSVTNVEVIFQGERGTVFYI